MIDLYCERLAPGLFEEPVNAFTNMAFFVAAWATWLLARRLSALDVHVRGLVALMIVIGAGSALFHTFATGWARILDEVPILLFQLYYLSLYLRNIMKVGSGITAVSIFGYLALALYARQFQHLLNGSLVYAPAVVVTLGLGLYHLLQRKTERALLLVAGGVFLTSITFRSIDEAVCPAMPTGTHFLWHILNAVVLYVVTRAWLLNRPRKLTIAASTA